MKATIETALFTIGIAHRWNTTALELLSPTTGEWITGLDLRGVGVADATINGSGICHNPDDP